MTDPVDVAKLARTIELELAHSLTRQGSVDEFWFWINPFIWAQGPRIFDGVGPVRLELVAATPYRSGVVWLRYRPAG